MSEITRRQLIISGGWAHPFERTTPFLADVLLAAGFESVIAKDLDEAATLMANDKFDLLTVYACWFGMVDKRYESVRSEWARASSPALRSGIKSHLDDGRGLLALHTAPICFDDWSEWPAIVGGKWNWERSWHPKPGQISIQPRGEHPIVQGVQPFQIVDERYTDLDISSDVDVIAWSVADDQQAAIWTHSIGSARVVYDALGHDESSLSNPDQMTLLCRAALWAAHAQNSEVNAFVT